MLTKAPWENLSNDALALVAVQLALRSQLLSERHDLCATFWHFYDLLVSEAAVRDKTREQLKYLQEREEQRKVEIESIRSLIEQVVGDAKKAQCRPYTVHVLRMAYKYHRLRRHPATVPDHELSIIRGIGPKSCADIRRAFPLAEGLADRLQAQGKEAIGKIESL